MTMKIIIVAIIIEINPNMIYINGNMIETIQRKIRAIFVNATIMMMIHNDFAFLTVAPILSVF